MSTSSFQAPITVRTAIDRIFRNEYVLPAIQREFVWHDVQIVRLFDSLMRGYPVSSFLFWKVDKEHVNEFKFYGFLREFHERDMKHNPIVNLTGQEAVTAILDGQQRLTSLYIGLRGTYSAKTKYQRRKNNAAYPKRRLYLNLSKLAPDSEDSNKFDLRFLSDDERKAAAADGYWFPVGDVLKFASLMDIVDYLRNNGLLAERFPQECLTVLYGAICEHKLVNFFEETEQDVEKVLNIFIRVNSAGTVLGYSDILLSIATAQWTKLDAREAIHDLVDSLNRVKGGFGLTKDFVLKSCLVLGDIPDVKFKVTNFNAKNMATIENAWPSIKKALRAAVDLAAAFGFTGATLTANNALIPIAYYLLQRGVPSGYVDSAAFHDDRMAVRSWLLRAILKVGTFGSGTDTLLNAVRRVIRDNPGNFPLDPLETDMAKRGKSLKFEPAEIDGLLELEYGQQLTFPVLALLYPSLDFANIFHEDHIFPRSRFTPARLKAAGVADGDVEEFVACRDQLPNLQLLEGQKNQEKLAKLPAEWMASVPHLKTSAQRLAWDERNFLPVVPADITDFLSFYDARCELLRARLIKLLG